MSKYYHDTFDNKITIDHEELYDTYNIIKGIHGHAHYFFNGFSEIKGTCEVVINLIKADLGFENYHTVLYNDNGKETMFSEKYKFVNFNNIKSVDIKNEIAEAIKERNPNVFIEMLECESPQIFNPSTLKPFYKWNAISADDFNYGEAAAEADCLLDDVVGCLPDEENMNTTDENILTITDRITFKKITKGGVYSIYYEMSGEPNSQPHTTFLYEGDKVSYPRGSTYIKVNNKQTTNIQPILLPLTGNVIAGNTISIGSAASCNGTTITIADHSASMFDLGGGTFKINNPEAISNNKILMSDGTSEVKWVDPPQNNGMKILSKNGKKKNNKISIEEDKLIIL